MLFGMMGRMTISFKNRFWAILTLFIAMSALFITKTVFAAAPMPENPQTGAVGLQGIIASPPPTQGASIVIPGNGQTFTSIPTTVSGLCPTGLLVKIFKNNVFAGSVQCVSGSYSLQIDLFSGANELVARVFDDLDQPGPDSNKVTVTYNDNRPGAGSRVTLSSIYAKRGANPGETLTWPIQLAGGRGPYAISVDWGDGKAADLKSLQFPGSFNIDHVYDNTGVYTIIIKATDADGVTAYLQLVGVCNGTPGQGNQSTNNVQPTLTPKTKILWEPAAIATPLLITSFWLGRRYERRMLRKRIERGDNPFTSD